VRKFLAGQSDPLIDMFQNLLIRLGTGPLSIGYRVPDLRQSFDDIRTYQIVDEAELHGIFESAWSYLGDALDKRSPPWAKPHLTDGDIDRVINDLIEKSIRNMSIREKWASGATPTK
jgi:hypothetical protein